MAAHRHLLMNLVRGASAARAPTSQTLPAAAHNAVHRVNMWPAMPPRRSASTAASTDQKEAQPEGGAAQDAPLGPPKLVVFGGRGFVGSHILQEALAQGLQAVSVSRSGTPPARTDAWTGQVEWVRGNALDPRSYEHLLPGAAAVITAVGGFGNNEQMLQVNGVANVRVIEAAAAAGVPRCVFISADIPNIPGIEVLLKGYVQGKRDAEAALQQNFPDSGVAIRPGVIYGNRVVSSSLTLPLQYLFQPLEAALAHVPARQLAKLPFVGAAATPPTDVKVVARAAVKAATDPSVPAGIIDVWDLPQYK